MSQGIMQGRLLSRTSSDAERPGRLFYSHRHGGGVGSRGIVSSPDIARSAVAKGYG